MSLIILVLETIFNSVRTYLTSSKASWTDSVRLLFPICPIPRTFWFREQVLSKSNDIKFFYFTLFLAARVSGWNSLVWKYIGGTHSHYCIVWLFIGIFQNEFRPFRTIVDLLCHLIMLSDCFKFFRAQLSVLQWIND